MPADQIESPQQPWPESSVGDWPGINPGLVVGDNQNIALAGHIFFANDDGAIAKVHKHPASDAGQNDPEKSNETSHL